MPADSGMIVNDNSQATSERPPPRRNGCPTALMVLLGEVLLLPAVWALIFIGAALGQPGYAGAALVFLMAGLIVGGFGIVVIWAAIRRPRR